MSIAQHNKKILISVGEASGDLHASNLIRSVLAKDPNISFYGMGGKLMQEAGAHILIDTSSIAIIGAVKILTNCFKIFRALNVMKNFLKVQRPDVLILVDYADFNFRLAKYAKKLGIKVIYYISPKLWAWRQNRVKLVKQYIDLMAVIFPFEVDFYKQWRISALFVGNPLIPIVHATQDKISIKHKYGLDINFTTIGLLPGSRRGEIERLLPVILDTASILQNKLANVQFVLPLASSIAEEEINQHLRNYHLNISIIKNDTYNAVSICDAAIVASGTATLETALLATPMVIIYKIPQLEYWLAKHLVKIKFIGLCNIVANAKIVQEYLQDDANPKMIAAEVLKILTDNNYRETMITQLKNVRQNLENNERQELATKILELLNNSKAA